MLAKNDEFVAEKFLSTKYPTEAEDLIAPFEMPIQHIEYVTKLIGVDYVGLGSDFDGIFVATQKMNDVTSYPLITEALVKKGYFIKDIRKILSGDIL